ncbi:unnamed protein product, partial [Brassica rapa subsp. trilocularis]
CGCRDTGEALREGAAMIRIISGFSPRGLHHRLLLRMMKSTTGLHHLLHLTGILILFSGISPESEYQGSHTDPGAIHASLLKLGFKTDQLLSKQLRLYGSCGSVEDARRLFYDSYNSELAGVAVWNSMIATLAINGDGNEAITMFENMPRGLSKTHATYWNTIIGCSHIGEAGYAHYLLGRAFKCSGIEPSMELLGTYVDGLARHGEGEKAVTTLKGMRYKPNQEMVVSILSKYYLNADPSTFAQDFVQYLEEQQVSFYIGKALYNELASTAGVVWKSN